MRSLTTTIEIHSTADAVWEVLMDFDTYPQWNPFIQEISGAPSPGSQLSVRLQNPGGKAMTFSPTVTDSEAPLRFSWLGKLGFKRVFDGHHRFGIEPTGNGSVIFTQSEEFSGAFVPILWGMVNTKTRAGFEAMNSALKERVEAR
jgi:hypothetical protein